MIAAATNTNKVKYRNGTTTDIMHEVIDCYKESNTQVSDFAYQLKGRTVEETCNNVWSFIKHNITYKIDPAGVQWVRTPARLWSDKVGDCKSFSVMAASLLAHNGITPTFRFASYSKFDNTPTHVYVVVKQPNKKEIIVDAVYTGFNKQKPYTFKKDYTMSQISRLSGVEDNNTITVISSPTSRKLAAQLEALFIERNNEAKANGGVLPANRAALYDKYIERTKKQLNKATNSNYADGISGGIFGNILGINAKLKTELEAGLPQTATAFLYLFIGGGLNPQDSYQPISVIDNLPIVTAKRNAAALCFWDLRGQIDNITGSDLSDMIRNAITQKLGMTPKEYWTRWFNGSPAISDDVDVADVALSAASLAFPPLGVLTGLASNFLPSLQFRPPIASFAPQMSDWASTPQYPKDKTLLLGNTKPQGSGGGGTVNNMQNADNTKTILGIAAAGAFALLR